MLAAALMGLSSVTSYAATTPTTAYYDIRFGGLANSYSGEAVIGNPTDYWNIIPGSAGTTGPKILKDTKGVVSLASLTFSYTADGYKNATVDQTGFAPTKYAELMSNYIYSVATTNNPFDTLTFSGLEASKDYGIYVLTQSELYTTKNGKLIPSNNSGDGQQLKLTINGTDHVQSVVSDGAASSFIEGQNYLKFDAKTDASGKLVIKYSSAVPSASSPQNRAVLNGIQVGACTPSAPTPEPASMLLLGVGGALLSARKLRKKKAAEGLVS